MKIRFLNSIENSLFVLTSVEVAVHTNPLHKEKIYVHVAHIYVIILNPGRKILYIATLKYWTISREVYIELLF